MKTMKNTKKDNYSNNPSGNKYSTGLMLLMVFAVFCLVCVGCNETQAQKTKAFHDQWDIKSAKAQIPLARNHFENGRLAEAKMILDGCFKADLYMPEANLLMGKIMIEEGLTERARNYFSNVIEVDDQCDEAFYWLGVTSQKLDAYADSIDYHKKAMALKPLDIKYIQAVSDALQSEGLFDEALELLKMKEKEVGRSSELKVAIADIYQYQGQTLEAISLYRQVLLLDGEDVEVINALGYCYVSQRNWGKALELFEQLLEGKEGDELVSHLELLGKCSLSNGDYAKALDYYNKLSVHKREDSKLWLNMGYAALGANSGRRALSSADRALTIQPGWNEAIALKGCAYYISGEYQKSVDVFSRILKDKSLGGLAWTMTGRCYEKLEMGVRAEKAFEMAKAIEPGNRFVSIAAEPK